MKKYILFLFVFTFIFGLYNINLSFANADAPVFTCAINITLRAGSSGEQVKCLQRVVGVTADGKFGPKTKAAVKAWQSAKNLVADGIFGLRLRAAWVAQGWGNPQSSVVISGVSGPQTLDVNQTGTWTVTASDKNGGTLSYSVFWGDEVYAYPAPMTSGASLPTQQSATFTHSYSQAGTYGSTFVVTNNIVCVRYPCPNSSASTSLSVNVGGGSSNTTPTISSLSSSSGVIGSQVTIIGNNFTTTGNKIKFGDSGNENNPAYNLSTNDIACFRYPCPESITFTVPSTYYVACHYSVPACEVATRMIQPGVYPVSVINANGTSNSVNFTVTSTYYY